MQQVRFYGDLKRFGERFELDVRDAAEAIRALCCQIPNLRQHIQKGWYKVRIGKNYITPEALEQGLFFRLKKNSTIHLTPVIAGAKSGFFGVVLGVALIGAAFLLGPVGWAAISASSAWMVGAMGASMLLGGVSQMLTKTPNMNIGTEAEKKQSTSFSNLGNLVAQGRPVPLAYGKILTGSLIISQGVETYNVEEEAKQTTKKTGFFKG